MSVWEPFTEGARMAVVFAQEEAARLGAREIWADHIVLGALRIDDSPLVEFIGDRAAFVAAYDEKLRSGQPAPKSGEMIFTPEAKQMIEKAFETAREVQTNFVGAEHLLASIARMPRSRVAKHLQELGVDAGALAKAMRERLAARAPESQRRSYLRAELLEEALAADPIAQIRAWLGEASATNVVEPNAMAVATVGEDGQPSTRIVLLRGLDERGLVFYTSYLSRKGRDISVNPRAAALFYWAELERQIRIEGMVEELDETESDEYFASRPRGHQLAAWASEQSEPVESRAILEQRVEDYRIRFEGEQVPRPHSWGGYRIRPNRIEFWQGRENRMHDRLEFVKDGVTWRRRRLSP